MDIDITERLNKEKKDDDKFEEHLRQTKHAFELDQELKESSDSKGVLIMVGVIVGLFVLIIGGMSYYNSITGNIVASLDDLHIMNYEGKLNEKQGYLYNGFSVVKNDGLWWTQVQGGGEDVVIPLHFGPMDLLDVEVTGKVDESFNKGQQVYIAIDPRVANQYYTLATSELVLNMAQGIKRVPEATCILNATICEGRPILTCDTTEEPVVELVLNGTAKIDLDGNCIRLSGQNEELVKAVDRLLYRWYGVMK